MCPKADMILKNRQGYFFLACFLFNFFVSNAVSSRRIFYSIPQDFIIFCIDQNRQKKKPKITVNTGFLAFWRRRRDSNPRAGFKPTYALSRGVKITQ